MALNVFDRLPLAYRFLLIKFLLFWLCRPLRLAVTHLGVPRSCQRYIFEGRQLRDEQTLADCKMRNGSNVVMLSARGRGGGTAPATEPSAGAGPSSEAHHPPGPAPPCESGPFPAPPLPASPQPPAASPDTPVPLAASAPPLPTAFSVMMGVGKSAPPRGNVAGQPSFRGTGVGQTSLQPGSKAGRRKKYPGEGHLTKAQYDLLDRSAQNAYCDQYPASKKRKPWVGATAGPAGSGAPCSAPVLGPVIGGYDAGLRSNYIANGPIYSGPGAPFPTASAMCE